MPAPRQVDDLAVDVVLHLPGGRVADAHRLRARKARQVVERPLGETPAAPNPVDDLEALDAARRAPLDEAAKTVSLSLGPEGGQGLHREDRVPDPAQAVVPVAAAPRGLGQRRRGGGRDRSRWGIGQALQHDR